MSFLYLAIGFVAGVVFDQFFGLRFFARFGFKRSDLFAKVLSDVSKRELCVLASLLTAEFQKRSLTDESKT